MLTVLVVDDDRVIREDICELLNWRRFGFAPPVQFPDGQSALTWVEAQPVDLIITDISMPVMNGVELIRNAKRVNPGIQCVVLSNYDDFAYVKEAMRLGARDYLLKYELDETILGGLLRDVNREAEQKSRKDTQHKAQQQAHENRLESMREYFWRDIYYGHIPEGKLDERLEALAIPARQGIWVPVLLVLKRAEALPPSEDIAALLAALPATSSYQFSVHFTQVEPTEWLLVLGGEENSFLYANSLVGAVVAQLHERFSLLEIQLHVLPGRFCTRFAEISEACVPLREERQSLFYEGFGNRVPTHRAQAAGPFPAGELRDLLDGLLYRDEESLRALCGGLFQAIRRGQPPEKAVRSHCAQGLQALEYLPPGLVEQYLVRLDGCDTLEGYEAAYEEILTGISAAFSVLASATRPETKKAVQYLYEHYSSPVSLEELAGHTGLSRTYFSRVFKEDTGINFVDYLNNLRIEAAKRLLRAGGTRTSEVAAQVGYEDYRYFCRVFKNTVGMTCSEYRRQVAL